MNTKISAAASPECAAHQQQHTDKYISETAIHHISAFHSCSPVMWFGTAVICAPTQRAG